MRTCTTIVLSLACLAGHAQSLPGGRQPNLTAHPESEAAAAWSALAASYVRKAIREKKLDSDPALNARVDAVIAGHAYEKLSFMAETLGRDKAPTARTALLEFLSKNTCAQAFHPVARLQEREADRIGASILFASGYDTHRALVLFDKLAECEARLEHDTHDPAAARRQAVANVLARLRNTEAASRP